MLDVERRLSKKHVCSGVFELGEVAQNNAGGRGRNTTDALELILAIGREVLDEGAQILEVEEGEAALVSVVKDKRKGGFLSLVETQHLREENRPEFGNRRANRHALTVSTQ